MTARHAGGPDLAARRAAAHKFGGARSFAHRPHFLISRSRSSTPRMSDDERSDTDAPALAAPSAPGGARKRVAADKPAGGLPEPTPAHPKTLDVKFLAQCTSTVCGKTHTSDEERRARIKAACPRPADVWNHDEFDPTRDVWAFEYTPPATEEDPAPAVVTLWCTPCRPCGTNGKEPDCQRGTYRMYAAATMCANTDIKAAVEAHRDELVVGMPMSTSLLALASGGGAPAAVPAKRVRNPNAAPRARKSAAKAEPAKPAAPVDDTESTDSVPFTRALYTEIRRSDEPCTPAELIARVAYQVHKTSDRTDSIIAGVTEPDVAALKCFTTVRRAPSDALKFVIEHFREQTDGTAVADHAIAMGVRSGALIADKAKVIYDKEVARLRATIADLDARARAIGLERDAANAALDTAKADLDIVTRENILMRGRRPPVPASEPAAAPAAKAPAGKAPPAKRPVADKRVPFPPKPEVPKPERKRVLPVDDDSTTEPSPAPRVRRDDSDSDDDVDE
jgi:hypothetical protein